MFAGSEKLYDQIYSFRDYRAEAESVMDYLRHAHPSARTVLDVACGTAEHDRYLADHYQVDGLDLNEDFIAIARRKNPRGTYACADMTDFSLARRYDAVICLGCSIGGARTREGVLKALKRFHKHVSPDGVAIIESSFSPESWLSGHIGLNITESEETKICRMSFSGREGSMATISFQYLIGTKNGIEYLTERHELALLTVEQMLETFESAGFQAEYIQNDFWKNGLYVARPFEKEVRNHD